MADYHKMYLHLFNEMTKAINILQDAQQAAEEMFISSNESTVSLAQAQEILKSMAPEENTEEPPLDSDGTNHAKPE